MQFMNAQVYTVADPGRGTTGTCTLQILIYHVFNASNIGSDSIRHTLYKFLEPRCIYTRGLCACAQDACALAECKQTFAPLLSSI